MNVQSPHPPVLVPPIRSKTSHGFGGSCWSRLFIRYSSIRRDESPRTPPPSARYHQSVHHSLHIWRIPPRESIRKPCGTMVVAMAGAFRDNLSKVGCILRSYLFHSTRQFTHTSPNQRSAMDGPPLPLPKAWPPWTLRRLALGPVWLLSFLREFGSWHAQKLIWTHFSMQLGNRLRTTRGQVFPHHPANKRRRMVRSSREDILDLQRSSFPSELRILGILGILGYWASYELRDLGMR